MNSTDAILTIIAVEVENSNHGDFLKTLAKAWQLADRDNRPLIKPAWVVIADKYKLADEYADAIEEHLVTF